MKVAKKCNRVSSMVMVKVFLMGGLVRQEEQLHRANMMRWNRPGKNSAQNVLIGCFRNEFGIYLPRNGREHHLQARLC